MTANDRWNRGSWHRRSAPSFNLSGVQETYEDETAEVVNLRRRIAEQNATLEEQRRRIEETEQQIDDYERRIHDDRCAMDGDDYLQRAYHLYIYDTYDDDDDDFVNRQISTEDTIAFYYRAASNKIRQRLVEVEAELVNIANNCRKITSAKEKHSGQVDELDRSCDVDRKAQSVVDGNAHRRRALCQLDALRLELALADDVRQQQLLERHRLSNAVEDAQSQLKHEEERLKIAMLAAYDTSSRSANIRKFIQPLEIKSKKFQKGGCQLYPEKSLQITRQPTGADCQVLDDSPVILATSSSTPDVKGPNNSGKSKNDDMFSTCRSPSICTHDDISTSNLVTEDARCGSLPDDGDLLSDSLQLVTFV